MAVHETPSPDSLFQIAPFVRFWIARICTAAANQMLSVAVAWQIYQLTGSAMDLGLVGLFQFLPRVFLTATAGNMADSHDRKRIATLAQVVQATVLTALLLLTLAHAIDRQWIFALVAVSGAARTFEMPATSSLLSTLVPSRLLTKAVALNASAIQAAFIVGPALAGLLYALGDAVVHGITLILFVAAAAAFASIPSAREERPAIAGSEWQKFVDGLRFIRGQRVVLGAISLDLFAVLFGGATALMPILAVELLHTGPWGLGLLRSAPSVGALLMSAVLARVPLEHHVGRIMFASVAVYAAATVGFGLSTSLWLSLALLAVLGAADMISMVIRGSLVQLQTPDHMRGRVSAVNSIFIGASNQLGEFESGVTAAWFGAAPAVILGGVCSLAVTALWMRWFPQLLSADRLAGRR
ncbi:MAG: MFS transporter [Rhodocyclaceae bacterium]|jgi:MFS family permease|nr:MFS transporter [Rhodocyclaceae bacterium]